MRENQTENKKSTGKKKNKKNQIINIAIYIVASLLIVFAILLLVREKVFMPSQVYTTPPPEGSEVTAQTMIPLGTPYSDYDQIPVKFYFVDREISCNIYPVGLDENNKMEAVASADDVSWLSTKPFVVPGDIGNSVIAGHNLWKGKAGTFSWLKKMTVGEVVAVAFDKGFSRYFKVVDIYECAYNDSSPMETDIDTARLTLITCAGDWSSSLGQSKTRVVVICEPIAQD